MLRGAGDFVQELALLLGCEDVGRAATEHLVDVCDSGRLPSQDADGLERQAVEEHVGRVPQRSRRQDGRDQKAP